MYIRNHIAIYRYNRIYANLNSVLYFCFLVCYCLISHCNDIQTEYNDILMFKVN